MRNMTSGQEHKENRYCCIIPWLIPRVIASFVSSFLHTTYRPRKRRARGSEIFVHPLLSLVVLTVFVAKSHYSLPGHVLAFLDLAGFTLGSTSGIADTPQYSLLLVHRPFTISLDIRVVGFGQRSLPTQIKQQNYNSTHPGYRRRRMLRSATRCK